MNFTKGKSFNIAGGSQTTSNLSTSSSSNSNLSSNVNLNL